jgi:tRNA(Ile)-lysidine synthase TilS/MesJ
MALASLCSGIQNKDQLRFRAFVVDHKVRAESGDEAQAVAKILEEKSMSFVSFCQHSY